MCYLSLIRRPCKYVFYVGKCFCIRGGKEQRALGPNPGDDCGGQGQRALGPNPGDDCGGQEQRALGPNPGDDRGGQGQRALGPNPGDDSNCVVYKER